MNKARFSECVLLQSHFCADEVIGVPLSLLPVFNKLKIEYEESTAFQLEEQQFGLFKVFEETKTSDAVFFVEEIVSFGGNVTFPSCTCAGWNQTHLPCIHMYAVFRNTEHCKYDSLSPLYRINPLLDFDYSTIDGKRSKAIKDNLRDLNHSVDSKSCQTGICIPPQPSTQNLLSSSFPSPTANKQSVFKEAVVFDGALLSQCKELQTQLCNLKGVFVSSTYEKCLNTDLARFITQLENCGKRSNKKNTKKNTTMNLAGDIKENTETALRQTSTQFISMSSFKKSDTTTQTQSSVANVPTNNDAALKKANQVSSQSSLPATTFSSQSEKKVSSSTLAANSSQQSDIITSPTIPKKKQRVVKIAKVQVGADFVIKSISKDIAASSSSSSESKNKKFELSPTKTATVSSVSTS